MSEKLDDFKSYEVTRSSRATKPRIDMDIHGMKVVIPEGMDLEPEELIEQKQDWINKKKRKFEEMRSRIPERKFEEGEFFPYKGEKYEIVLDETNKSQVRNQKFVLSKKPVNQEGLKNVLENLYRKEARQFINNTVDEYAPELNVDYDTIRVKNQKTLWGSCSSKKNLNFNWRLIMAPPDKAEYVIIHELCHLREPNHSPSFWRLLSNYCDNHEQKAEWMNEHSVELIFTVEDL